MHFSNSEVTSVKIYSITGKLLTISMIANSQVDVSQMNSGLYIVKAYDQQNKFINTIKVINE